MRVGLAVIRVTQDYGINVDSMVELIREAAREGADLVLFGEAAPTGLINNDDPTHDMAIAQPIIAPTANILAQGARESGVY
ncbi:MAG TPA: carbon-nitrogen hydrolase family protein, partial [Firmicutes bacterium]|nr:carbon-nitrogen hydrolase family protein [Bacillota bacterium]